MQAPLTHIRKLEQKLGIGACGVVYLGFDDQTGGFVAIKEIPYHDSGDVTAAARVLQEVHVMQRFRPHANLVGYRGARPSSVGVQLIMEYVGGGSLERLLRLRGRLSEDVVRRYARDVLTGLRCLHEEMHVCHRDVKPGNILLTPEGICKLTDFGVSKMLLRVPPQPAADANVSLESCNDTSSEGSSGLGMVLDPFMQTTVGTPWYMAPEVISGGGNSRGHHDGSKDSESSSHEDDGNDSDESLYYNPLRGVAFRGRGQEQGDGREVQLSRYEREMRAQGYTTSADVWSLGVTVFEMISGQRPFGGGAAHPTAVLFAIIHSASQPPRLPEEVRHSVSRELRNFLDLCFVYDKGLRPCAAELLAHPWLTGIPESGRSCVSSAVSKSASTATTAAAGLNTGAAAATSVRPPFLRAVASPVMDAADLPARASATTAGVGPSIWARRQISASSPQSAANETSPTVAVGGGGGGGGQWPVAGASGRRSSSPYSGGGSTSSVSSPAHSRGTGQGSALPLSLPPELPTLPGRAAGPLRGQPKGRRPSSQLVDGGGGGGFFSLDGHYVDLITRLPSPKK